MIKLIAVVAVAMIALGAQANTAFACNKINGCMYDYMYENYDMMRDGDMDKAMAEGRANVEAFRVLQERERRYAEAMRHRYRRY